jgi:ABC-type lipoprotein export system ATPase subunit
LLDLKKKALREFRQKRMGFIFQDYNLLDTLTVKENILLPLSLQKTPVREMEQRLAQLIEALNIDLILTRYLLKFLADKSSAPLRRVQSLRIQRLCLLMSQRVPGLPHSSLNKCNC